MFGERRSGGGDEPRAVCREGYAGDDDDKGVIVGKRGRRVLVKAGCWMDGRW